MTIDTAFPPPPRRARWRVAWLAAAFVYVLPVGYAAYTRVVEVTHQAREQLIVRHRLWELHPEYQGSPQMWTRVAARLLTDNQIMRRVRERYGRDLAREIELDYNRDLVLAQSEVVLAALAAWAIPVGALYGLGYLIARRRRRPPGPENVPDSQSRSDARYRP